MPKSSSNQPGGLRIGFAGRFTSLKGGDLLIQAVSRLPETCRLIMGGTGEMEGTWRQMVESLGIGGRVFWMGALHHGEIPGFLRTLDVLVLPSRTGSDWKEQFGRILIEAMAAGVAVVGSSSGEIPRVIGDAGYIFPEGDVAALTHILHQLAENPSLVEESCSRGWERVMRNFSFDAVLPRYAALFESLTGAMTSPRGKR